jgi:SulP family sulfate permease
MLVTVVVTVLSANLALGVTIGVLLSGVFFTFKVARLMKVETVSGAGLTEITYRVSGQVFFASADAFIDAFDIAEAEGKSVVIDVSQAHFWDITAVAALEMVVGRFRAHHVETRVVGLNAASATLMESLDSPARLQEI